MQGCLSYFDQKCYLCDQLNGFVMINGNCVFVEQTGCQYLYNQKNCLQCEKDFLIDKETGKCIQMIQEYEVKNCLKYTSDFLCQFCEENYFLHNAACFKVEQIIQNCLYYSNQQLCILCEKGYYNNFKSCTQTQHLDNCIYSSKLQCQKCKEQYGLNENFYLENFIELKNFQYETKQQNFDHQNFLNIYMSEILFQNNQQCQPITFQNCTKFKFNYQCQVCNDNFYEQNGQCYKYPESRIQNCQEYASKDVCYECIEGYFLNLDFICQKNTNILNCEKYSPFQHLTSQCILCLSNHYVFDGQCVARYNKIQFCEKYSVNEDNCQKCLQGYKISENGEKCLKEIQNCYKQQQINQILECIECQNGYYLDEQQCKKGSINNCFIYIQNKDECQKCQKTYKLVQKNCQKIKDVENCIEYDDETSQCQKCNEKYILLKQMKNCISVNLISACIEYKDKDKCKICENGYQISDDFKCKQIPKEMNCQQLGQDQICEKCQEDFLLQNNVCQKIPQLWKQGCLQSNEAKIKNMKDFKCQICRDNYLPVFQKNMFNCLETNIIKIENCIKFIIEDNNYLCVQCQKKFILLNNQCVEEDQCMFTLNMFNFDKQNKYIQSLKVCKEFIEGCKYSSVLQNTTNEYKCFKCKEGYKQIIKDFKNEYINTFDIYQEDQVIDKPIIDCVKENQVLKIIDNCEYYIFYENDYYCKSCKLGYVGIISQISNFTFLKSCKESSYCLKEHQIGINQKLYDILSCQKCTSQNEILYIKLNFDKDTEQIENQLSIECKQYKHILPLYCSIGSISYIENNEQYNCLSCKPGFRPIKNNDLSDKIIQCEVIENCLESKWDNSCSKCKPGYSWLYIKNQIMFDLCVKTEQNCLILHEDQNIGCISCENSFYLENDDCQYTNFINEFEYKNLNILVFKNSFFPGCQKCSENSINALMMEQNNNYICLLKTNKKQLIEFCTNYSIIDNEIKCESCLEKRIPNLTQKQCLNIQSENCKVINEYTNACHQCKDYWVVENGICKMPSIQACLKYENNSNSIKQVCLQCIPGYYLNSGICLKIEIQNCLQLDQNQRCYECQDNYILANSENQSFCVQKILNSACLNFTQINNKYFSCTRCEFGYFLQDLVEDICLPINNIDKCLEYQLNNDLIKCTRCEQDYQLIQNKCLFINQFYSRCESFYINEEKCRKCKRGFYLNYEQNCIPNPTGISYCQIYNNQDTCFRCQTGYYLADNLCFKSEAFLQNCKYYADDQKCLQCDNQYYNDNGICVFSELKNCEQFIDLNNCEKCEDGFYIIEHFNQQICKQIQKDQKCLEIKSEYPYHCKRCQKDYYPSETNCFEVENLVENCIYYDEQQNCEVCTNEYYLSKQKQCLSHLNIQFQFDINCEITKEVDPFCLICNLGYYVNSGKCVQCQIQNCAICPPNQSNNCLICQPGYIMYSNQCIANQNLKDSEIQLLKNNIQKYIFTYVIFMIII